MSDAITTSVAVTDGSDQHTWDATTDPNNPQPMFWPVCPTCSTTWVWKQFLSLQGGYTWAWAKDCKHKAMPVLHTSEGPYKPEGKQ